MTTLTTRVAPKNARMATIDRLLSAGGMNPAMTAAMRQTRARLEADQPAVPMSDTARIAALEGRVAGLEARVEQLGAAAAPPRPPSRMNRLRLPRRRSTSAPFTLGWVLSGLRGRRP